MHTLIVYGSNSGGTQEAAELTRDVFRERRFPVTCKSARNVDPDELKLYGIVVLGSCTWDQFPHHQHIEGQLQQDFAALRERLRGKHFPHQQFAIFALGDSRYNKFCAAADHLEALVTALGGTHVGTTLRIDGFFFRLAENRQRVTNWATMIAEALHHPAVR